MNGWAFPATFYSPLPGRPVLASQGQDYYITSQKDMSGIGLGVFQVQLIPYIM